MSETKKILIIDDSVIIRKTLRAILEKGQRYEVYEATNGEEGYRQYCTLKPDLVTMDIMMDKMNGMELTKKIIEQFPDAKIVMISSNDQREKVVDAVKSGAKNYIVKPFSEDRVIATIRAIIG